MTITFTPRRGGILMCDFDPDPLDPCTFPLTRPPLAVAPEMWKVRQVVVVSPAALNHRHGTGPGVCVVVPFSATPPRSESAWDVPFAARAYSQTMLCWLHGKSCCYRCAGPTARRTAVRGRFFTLPHFLLR